MKRKPKAQKLVKTSISLPEVLHKFAEERVESEGFTSFSAYIQYLIRMDKDKHRKNPGSETRYPVHRDQISRIEDKP